MKKKLFTGMILAGAAFSLYATPITPEQALERVGYTNGGVFKAPGAQLAHTALTAAGSPAMYVFNRPMNGGYMIVSADDVAYPLLGYADSGSFSEEEMPPQMKWWLEEYARQIQYASEHPSAILNSSVRKAYGEAISPQLKTKWDQVAPYNDMCPLYGTQRTYTGCVATAMAQVMNYWKYPEVGQGNISYDSESLGKRLSLNFANRKFEWDKMLDTYDYGQYTDEEGAAVAYLMKAAGYSVKMDYAADSSGALAMNIANGLLKYFDYDPNMFYTLRMYYSASEWEKLIYDNLKNVGPVLYGGGSMLGGGHSFVCDGYDGNGYFHFNWGWSGMSDGYFSLDALNPQSLGSGGGTGGGYNFTQDAVLGIQPPTGLPAEDRPLKMSQMGSLAGVITGNNLKFDLFAEEGAMWVNYNPTTMKLRFGAVFEPQGDTEGDTKFILVSNQAFSIAPGYGTDPSHLNPTVNLGDAGLSDGTYKVTFATIPTEEENPQYVPVQECYGYYNYIILKKEGDKYSLDINPVDRLSVKDGGIIGDLYYGCMATVSVTVVNDNDIELTKGFAPALIMDNTLYFLGESVFLTVQPGEEVTREWTTSFTLLQQMMGITTDTEFQLTFFDESSYNFYAEDFYKTVVMKPVLDYPNISLIGEPVITGAEVVREKVGLQTRDVYVVKDRMNIGVDAKFMLRSGIFSYTMYACTCLPDWTGVGTSDVEILSYAGCPMQMEENEEANFSTTLAMPNAQPDKYYMLLMAYEIQGMLIPVTGQSIVFRLADPSGIDSVEADDISSMPIYNLQGVYLGYDWEALPAGIYIRAGKKLVKK
ncbi:MAG: hypothetical protein HDR88_13750 [Bacteroides sp.]|nr:hypothetical protein [Bacteroides sp.]